MTNENSGQERGSSSSRKRLVKILVIVGIGIPVLVELMTLFNLINVQFLDTQSNQPDSEDTVEAQTYSQGDTLFKDSMVPIRIDMMEINVSTNDWKFNLQLSAHFNNEKNPSLITVDSLRLKSGKFVGFEEPQIEKTTQDGRLNISVNSSLPNSDIPQILYLSMPPPRGDTLRKQQVNESITLGHIPVRYVN